MELPSTRPSGGKPTSRTSRNSLTDRSDVKIAPGRPGRSSARRRIASCGTPCNPRSVLFWSVIVLLGWPYCLGLVWCPAGPGLSDYRAQRVREAGCGGHHRSEERRVGEEC